MSTRSLIGVQNTDKTINWTYCHFDGYPEHHEPILHKSFNDYDSILELVTKGELRALGETLDDCEYFNDPHIMGKVNNLKEFLELDCGADFKYLFRDNEWYYVSCGYQYTPDMMEILPKPYKYVTVYDEED